MEPASNVSVPPAVKRSMVNAAAMAFDPAAMFGTLAPEFQSDDENTHKLEEDSINSSSAIPWCKDAAVFDPVRTKPVVDEAVVLDAGFNCVAADV